MIKVTDDGNSLYNSISYYFYGAEEYQECIKKNIWIYYFLSSIYIYDYFYEKKIYYLDVTESNRAYFIEDYIDNIKNNRFFGGFIEINCISKMYNIFIIVLEGKETGNYIFI